MTVIRKKGSMITASGDGQNITRNSSFFKRINDQPQDTVPSEVPDMSPTELTPKLHYPFRRIYLSPLQQHVKPLFVLRVLHVLHVLQVLLQPLC